MKDKLKWLFGFFIICFGVACVVWIGFQLFDMAIDLIRFLDTHIGFFWTIFVMAGILLLYRYPIEFCICIYKKIKEKVIEKMEQQKVDSVMDGWSNAVDDFKKENKGFFNRN